MGKRLSKKEALLNAYPMPPLGEGIEDRSRMFCLHVSSVISAEDTSSRAPASGAAETFVSTARQARPSV